MAQKRVADPLGIFSTVTQKILEDTFHLSSTNSSPDGTRRCSSFGSIGTPKSWHLVQLLDPTREPLLVNVNRLTKTKLVIGESYKTLKKAFKDLQDTYTVSKDSLNCYQRYADMKHMIKQVLILETHGWILIDLPKQEANESQVDYITKIVNLIEHDQCREQDRQINKSPIKKVNVCDSPQGGRRYSNISESLKNKSTDELKREYIVMQNNVYVLVTKYQALRDLALQLKVAYDVSKPQQTLQRYYTLKQLIKDTLRAPSFSAVCHEIDDF